MKHPRQGSDAVLAGFVLANNYWSNDAYVGVANFSADMACLLPSRDLDKVYSLLCAYWGGGTVLNIPKIKEYLKLISQNRGGPDHIFTTEQDYEQVIKNLHPQQRKEFVDKHIEVHLNKEIREVYEKMDTVLITDGEIYNLPEVIDYINQTAVLTRNIIFLIHNPRQYQEWSQLALPNTQLVHVDMPQDLLNLAIGQAKRSGPPEAKPASLFWR